MAKRKQRRPRSFSEKVLMVMGILIAVSMILSLIAAPFLGGAGF